jgi:hypothetical protein
MIAGASVAGFRLLAGKTEIRKVAGVVGVPTLVGLFGVAVALGRLWAGPTVLLSHLHPWGTAAVAAVSTVLLNNLPAASLLAARTPGHRTRDAATAMMSGDEWRATQTHQGSTPDCTK